MIYEKIKNDTHQEFLDLQRNIAQTYLKRDFDINLNKTILKKHVPSEVSQKGKLLLDTLLNYLMEKAINDISKADNSIQDNFYKYDFRKRVNSKLKSLEELEYSFDPRLKRGLIAGGVTFIAGAIITSSYFLPDITIGTIITGIITIAASIGVFKLSYKSASDNARETIKKDIILYLSNSEILINNWLKTIIDSFVKEFNEFCNKNNFKLN